MSLPAGAIPVSPSGFLSAASVASIPNALPSGSTPTSPSGHRAATALAHVIAVSATKATNDTKTGSLSVASGASAGAHTLTCTKTIVTYTASASSEDGVPGSSALAFKAFDGVYADNFGANNSFWSSNDSGSVNPRWLAIQTPTAKNVKKYRIQAVPSLNNCAPTTWSLDGSNNGIDWTQIDSQTVSTDWYLEPNNEREFATAGNVASYLYHRLYMTAFGGGGLLAYIGEFTLFESDGGGGFTGIVPALAADTVAVSLYRFDLDGTPEAAAAHAWNQTPVTIGNLTFTPDAAGPSITGADAVTFTVATGPTGLPAGAVPA